MALDWINEPWAKETKEAFEYLDNNIDITEYLHDYYDTVEDIINKIEKANPETEKVLSLISEEEFLDYLKDRYEVFSFEDKEIIITYYIKKDK